MKLGLAAIDALCERLGRPERQAPSVLIAGTNGKGSTAATLAAIAAASGLRAGLYTSPHLIRVTERIRIEERDISDEALDATLARVFLAADAAPPIPLTYFEALTAAAFLAFAEQKLHLAILEVGLGGRFDATNVAPSVLSVVTSIGFDHTQELGPTLSSIAREKAGIFRRGRPALGRARFAEALEALRASAEGVGAVWHDAGEEVSVSDCEVTLDETRFLLTTPERSAALQVPLPGAHQAWNAALAVRSAELLSPEFGLVTAESIVAGVAAVYWPGRLERFHIRGRCVVLDGCHNREGAAALARFLGEAGLEGKCPLVFGVMEDKDIEGIAEILFRQFASVTFVTAPSARAATATELLRRVGSLRPDAATSERVKGALETLLAKEDTAPIIVAGSLYLVGEARALILSGALTEA